ncbi:MAG: hypothetical protein ACE5F1_03250 [Planctomycetota bacterium]
MKLFELTRGRIIRWSVFMVAATVLYLGILRRFRYYRLGDGAEAMAPALVAGGRFLVDLEPARRLERDWVVAWQPELGVLAYSRVVAVPGDSIVEQQGWAVRTSGGDTISLPAGLELRSPVRLARDEYFLLNDRPDVPRPDSRDTGPVPRERIHVHILFPAGRGAVR